MTTLDRRLNAFRPDLADERLAGQVEAERFVAGEEAFVSMPVVNVHTAPDRYSGMDTQLLHGDGVCVFERGAGWAWVQAARDRYVGYVEESALTQTQAASTHVVSVPRSFVYPEPELKTPPVTAHSMGARVAVVEEVENRGTLYAVLASGEAMIARHLLPVGAVFTDFVSVAEQFIHAPYLWGGASGFGLDCSGLVQLSMFMAGQRVPRDTYMQANIGSEVETEVKRGDLVFWRGHVAILTDDENVIHANGYTMTVSREPLAEATRRIEPFYGRPVGFRRLL
ncbi:NlpC/P60 family protein [Chelativorans sp. Marseille-P2723]|uniref:C40 family peptidase n=1 Tax=Chelativorans sp. Marseille-P2723 TaxID=2709133 RepID=UPI00156FCF56|nr:NlpC/P60 family protein [Chelativorans sp. Marseille-P2723]